MLMGQTKQAIVIYIILSIINVVVFGVELNYGTIKSFCREEVAETINAINQELQSEEFLTQARILEIKESHGLTSEQGYVINTTALVEQCVNDKAWFNLEF